MILNGDGLAHLRVRIVGGPVALRHRNRGEVILVRAVLLHVPARREGVGAGRTPEAGGRAERADALVLTTATAATAVRRARAAAGGQRRVGEDASDRGCLPAGDRQ